MRQYLRIFRWHVLRYLRRHPLLGLLNILSVALGGRFSRTRANHFAASVDLIAGKAELEITGDRSACSWSRRLRPQHFAGLHAT